MAKNDYLPDAMLGLADSEDDVLGKMLTEGANEILRLQNSHEALVEALEEIAEGRGPFNRDNHQFACNVIENSKRIAREALALARGGAE